jgi:hypothetical protein
MFYETSCCYGNNQRVSSSTKNPFRNFSAASGNCNFYYSRFNYLAICNVQSEKCNNQCRSACLVRPLKIYHYFHTDQNIKFSALMNSTIRHTMTPTRFVRDIGDGCTDEDVLM